MSFKSFLERVYVGYSTKLGGQPLLHTLDAAAKKRAFTLVFGLTQFWWSRSHGSLWLILLNKLANVCGS